MTILIKQPLSLFHFDTDLLDTSGKVWTTTNSPVVSAGQSVFGGSSCKFTNSYFKYANTLIDTSKDFTVSYREYLTSLNQSGAVALSTNANSAQGILLGYNGTTFYASTSGGGWEINYTMATSAEVLNQWVHWELTYVASSKTLRLFKDGILKNTWTLANHFPMVNNNWIGWWDGSARNGYIDEVLITQECLHTTNFTPPTSAYQVPLSYWLAKTKNIPSYWSYKTNSWVDVGLPTTDADIATLFVNQGTNTCPTQQQLELLGTGVNRPNRCCYQPVLATQPTININTVPTGKTVKPEELLHISSIEGIDSVSVANTISTGINDETGKIWSKVGSPILSNTQSKFGTSLYLDGSSYISTPTNADFNFGTGDFTVDWWEYRNSTSQGAIFATSIPQGVGVGGQGGLLVGYGGNTITAYAGTSTSDWGIFSALSMGTVILNKWTHYAIVRNGTSFKTYQNGVFISECISNARLADVSTSAVVGVWNNYYNGYIDELRISKGIARWTANFTPPTAPYTKDVDTISLLHFDSSVVKLKLAVTLDLITYYKFNGSAWEVIDINTNQDNMMDIATVTSINRSQWDLLTNGTASGIAFAYYLDLSGTGDTVKIDKTSLVVDMKGEWNSAIKGTDFRYGYPANDLLKVTLLTTGNYKINYVGG